MEEKLSYLDMKSKEVLEELYFGYEISNIEELKEDDENAIWLVIDDILAYPPLACEVLSYLNEEGYNLKLLAELYDADYVINSSINDIAVDLFKEYVMNFAESVDVFVK